MTVLDTQFLGWLAAALTLATFVSRDMLRLRLLALAANMAFIAYGLGGGLWPVATLHLLLVPVNLLRLLELQRGHSAAAPRRWAPRRRPMARTPVARRRGARVSSADGSGPAWAKHHDARVAALHEKVRQAALT